MYSGKRTVSFIICLIDLIVEWMQSIECIEYVELP
jgi:hypothetical protein